jgi:hypothetical protein
MSGGDLLTINEAADYGSLLAATLRAYVSDGVIPSLVVDGRRLVRRCDMDEYVRTRKGRIGRPADPRAGRRPDPSPQEPREEVSA